MAQDYSFEIDKGTTWKLSCEYKDSNCNVINITGASFAAKLRNTSQTGVLILDFGVSITDAVLGKFELSLTASQTALIPTGYHVYDVEMTLAGIVYRLFEGTINARAEATY
jgi:hypothetical protein